MLIRPIRTQELEDGFCTIRTGISNLYLMRAGSSWIAFDAGMRAWMVSRGLRKLGIDPKSVSHVFLTHSDYDHAGGLRAFPEAKVYLSKSEEPMIDGRKARLLVIRNRKIPRRTTLQDRQTVTVQGRSVQLVSTPGHTPGSACYWVDGKALIAGDTLRVTPDRRFTPFMFLQNMDHKGDKRSLDMLEKEGFLKRARLVATGHTGVLIR